MHFKIQIKYRIIYIFYFVRMNVYLPDDLSNARFYLAIGFCCFLPTGSLP